MTDNNSSIFYEVKIEDEVVSDFLDTIEVQESDSRANMATLTFGDSNLILSEILHEGLSVEIDLGRSDAHAVIFRGLISGVRATFPRQGQPQTIVTAMERAIELNFQSRTRTWGNTTINQIIAAIAADGGNDLRPGTIEASEDEEVEETFPRQQVEQTDLAFLYSLAREYDSRLYIEHTDSGDTLNFVSTQTLLDADPVEEMLTFHGNLLSFSVSGDSEAGALQQQMVTSDPLSGESIEISEDPVTGELEWEASPELLARLGENAERLLPLIAKSARKLRQDYLRQLPRQVGVPSRPASRRATTLGDRARRLGLRGEGQAQGSIWLRPYRRVQIGGCSNRWSGEWYLAEVTHQVDIRRRSYVSSFTCTR
jgi:phage protein D